VIGNNVALSDAANPPRGWNAQDAKRLEMKGRHLDRNNEVVDICESVSGSFEQAHSRKDVKEPMKVPSACKGRQKRR
jgi:hypothetical protein